MSFMIVTFYQINNFKGNYQNFKEDIHSIDETLLSLKI